MLDVLEGFLEGVEFWGIIVSQEMKGDVIHSLAGEEASRHKKGELADDIIVEDGGGIGFVILCELWPVALVIGTVAQQWILSNG